MGDICDKKCEDVNMLEPPLCDNIELIDGCMCKPDYYRNNKGVCVPEDKCGCTSEDGIVVPVSAAIMQSINNSCVLGLYHSNSERDYSCLFMFILLFLSRHVQQFLFFKSTQNNDILLILISFFYNNFNWSICFTNIEYY